MDLGGGQKYCLQKHTWTVCHSVEENRDIGVITVYQSYLKQNLFSGCLIFFILFNDTG